MATNESREAPRGERPTIHYMLGMEMLLWLKGRKLITEDQAGRAAYEWGMAHSAAPTEKEGRW